MMLKFKKYGDKCSLVLAVATILDPHYKMELIMYYYKEIYGGDAEK